jgi:hypothetical protein
VALLFSTSFFNTPSPGLNAQAFHRSGDDGCHCLSPWRIPTLETIVILLVVLWLLGLVSSYTMGGLIHLLLIIAVIVLLLRLIRGRGV